MALHSASVCNAENSQRIIRHPLRQTDRAYQGQGHMPIENEVFENCAPEEISWEDQVFVFCTFRGIRGEGLHNDASFIDCTFEQCDFYLCMFNVATLVGVTFKHCDFHGGSFAGCRLVECVFDNCNFGNDNMGGEWRADGSRWYGCSQRDCEGLDTELVPVRSLDC